jgi:hypothetical protein
LPTTVLCAPLQSSGTTDTLAANATAQQPSNASELSALSKEAAALQRSTTGLPVQYRFNQPYVDDKTWRAAKLARGERPAMMGPCALRPDVAPINDGNVLFGAGAVGGDGNVQHSSQVRSRIRRVTALIGRANAQQAERHSRKNVAAGHLAEASAFTSRRLGIDPVHVIRHLHGFVG